MPKFEFPVTFTFTGTITIEADRVTEALTIVKRDCGCVLGPITATNEQVIDWDINTHPDMKVSLPKIIS